jgi:hypothetical protein
MASADPSSPQKRRSICAFNDLHDEVGARQAFEVALRSGNEEQAGLAAMNLAAMDQLSAERAQGHGHDERDDGVNVATDRDAPLKFRRWFKRS